MWTCTPFTIVFKAQGLLKLYLYRIYNSILSVYCYFMLYNIFGYTEVLTILWQVFEKPLLECQILSPQDVQKIFVNWREIIDCNYMFLRLGVENLNYSTWYDYVTANRNLLLCAWYSYKPLYLTVVRFGESSDFHALYKFSFALVTTSVKK
jgi:hypothetical protein